MANFKVGSPQPIKIKGKPLKCVICGHNHFIKSTAQLNNAFSTFFNFDWTDPSATCLTCTGCGYIHWFLILE